MTAAALRRFERNPWGVVSLGFIALMLLLSVFAYVLAPDNSENANQMHLSIHSKPPGFKVDVLRVSAKVDSDKPLSGYFSGFELSDAEIPVRDFKVVSDSLYVTEYSDEPELALVRGFSLADFPGFDQMQDVAESRIQPKTFWLGTDKYGRDLLSRMLVGSRVSLSIGFVAVAISLIVGVFFGALGGYYGGKVDAAVMWLVNIIWSIPTLLLVIAITLALGKGFWQVFVAVGLTMWVEVARVVRGQIIGIKQMQYITAARALGYGDFRIVTRHILPNVTAPLIVISAANFASAILVESGLSFLGLGAQPPTPSWGGIIKDHYAYIILGKPYLAMVPGFAIMLVTLAFMLMGNALRDALDVKTVG